MPTESGELWAMPEMIDEDQVFTFREYQALARRTAIYPAIGGAGELYPALELANEAGELLGIIKKRFRDHRGTYDIQALEATAAEAGDVLWALSQLLTELGLSLEQVARGNIDKLASRKARGVIGGSGDKR